MSIGTSSSYLGLSSSAVQDPRLLGPVPEAFGQGTIAQQGGQTSAGAVPEWFARHLAPGVSLEELDAEAASIEAGCEGVWALDTWQGCRTPFRNPAARGMWGGLTLAHTRPHLFRAALEAVAFGGRAVLGILREAGVPIRELVAVGGATRSNLWMQIHANIFGEPILGLAAQYPVTLGAAMCAATGLGAHRDLPTAAAAMSRTVTCWQPDSRQASLYEPLYRAYINRLVTNASAHSSSTGKLHTRQGAGQWSK